MKAPCPVYRKCSGCSQMQFPYVKQLHDKTKLARAELGRFVPADEDINAVVHPVTASPQELGYRTSTKLCLGEDDFGRKSIGLYERGTKKVVAIPNCPVHHPAINQLVARLTGGRVPMPAAFYNHARRGFQAGRLKFLTVRYCPDTDAFGIVVSHTGVAHEALAQWAANVAQPNISIYEATLSKADDDLILSEKSTHLAGPPDLPFTIGDKTYRLRPQAFFQANFGLTLKFVEHITSGIGGDTLLDLYGGFGAYGIAAAPNFKKVYVVDSNQAAVDAAKQAQKALGITSVVTAKDGVEVFLERRLTADERSKVTYAIVNPPRSGLSTKVTSALSGPQFAQLTGLTYVSCNLETLKRDLGHLTSVGRFRVQSVVPFDMFPQTDHLELVVKLTRRPLAAKAKTRPSH